MQRVLDVVRRAFGRFRMKLSIPRIVYRIELRYRIVIATIVMSALMLFSTFFFFDKAFIFIPLFVIFAFAMTYFGVLEGIERIEWVTLFIMPVLFTIGAYLFYYLFPVRWLTRIPFISIYAVSIYGIILISNILNVRVEKNLQLYRAAFSFNYLFQTLLVFLLYNTLLSFRGSFLFNMVGAIAISFPLILQFFWTVRLSQNFDRELIQYSLFVVFLVAESAIIFSFIPFTQTVFALVLTIIYYTLAGLTYAYLDQRLFKETIREYIFVLIFVLGVAALTVQW